jgi:hypothetical protein
MRSFTVTTEGQDKLGLRAIAKAYINDQWFAAHASDELAADALLDQFKRAVRQELELLECRAVTPTQPSPKAPGPTPPSQ